MPQKNIIDLTKALPRPGIVLDDSKKISDQDVFEQSYKNVNNVGSMVKQCTVPAHVGIILDGNRRWAKQHGLDSQEGHKQGFEAFKRVADAGLDRGIKCLSVFAFSTENWHRAKKEVNFLMHFIKVVMKGYVKELHKKNIRFLWLGSEEGLSKSLIKQLRNAEETSKNNTKALFCLCFNYGGQQEIIESVKSVLAKNQQLSPQMIEANLYGGNDVPPIDLLIRTSGEQRISNYMLWRAAYSELYFSPKLWPDFTPNDLDCAINDYSNRQRRYGL